MAALLRSRADSLFGQGERGERRRRVAHELADVVLWIARPIRVVRGPGSFLLVADQPRNRLRDLRVVGGNAGTFQHYNGQARGITVTGGPFGIRAVRGPVSLAG